MFHHVALATRDIRKSHHFYSEVMGFGLIKAVKRKAPGGGWTKHIFYDVGGGEMFALWDLRGIEGVQIEPGWKSAMSTGLGLPWWVNHVSFNAGSREELERRKQAWLDHGYHVSEVDHEFIRSIYTLDPDGTLVEWVWDVRPLNAQDREEALAILEDDEPATIADYEGDTFRALVPKWRPEGDPRRVRAE